MGLVVRHQEVVISNTVSRDADPSLSTVNAATVDQVPYTTEPNRLRTVGGQLLVRARDAGAIRADLTDQDLLPLMCGVAYAASVHAGAAHLDAARRYLDMLLTGLRTGPEH